MQLKENQSFSGSMLHIDEEGFQFIDPLHLSRLLHYGDGLFETIRVENGRAPLFDQHWERMTDSAKYFSFLLEPKITKKWKEIVRLELEHLPSPTRLKLILTRSEGNGFAPKSPNHPLLLFLPQTLSVLPELPFLKLKLSNRLQVLDAQISNHKTCNSMPYILAADEKIKRSCDGIILHNKHEGIIECHHANIFFFSGKHCVTPYLQSGCLNGVCRKWVIQQLRDEFGVSVIERKVTKDEIPSFSEAIICNALRGPAHVQKIDSIEFPSHDFSDQLQKMFRQLFF